MNMKIINPQPAAFLHNLEKAYTEGVYADTPANRKLGRVGMSYAEWIQKQGGNTEQKVEKEEVKRKGNQDIKIDVPHLAIFNEEGEEFDLESLSNDTKRKLNDINIKYQNYIDKISKSLKSKSIKEKFNPICLNVDKIGNITYDSNDIFGGEGIFSYGRILNDKGKDIDREKFFTISSNLKNSLEKWINDDSIQRENVSKTPSSASSKSNPFQS